MLDLFFRKYAWTANLLIVFLAAWFTARMVNTLVGAVIRPRPHADLSAPSSAPRQPPALVLDDTRLYHLIGVEPPAQPEAVATQTSSRPQNCADPSAQPVKSQLRLSLQGAALAEIPRDSLATITDATSNESHAVGVGDRVANAEVLALERIRTDGDITGNGFKMVAIICNAGTKEYVEADSSISTTPGPLLAAVPNLGTAPVPRPGASAMEGVRSVGTNRYEIDRKVIDSTLSDLNQIATQARIVPSFKNGVANGFKLFSIQPGSLYSAIGIENGDVIQRINGYEINSPEKALELYQKLRESSHVTIDGDRNGAPYHKEYNIVGSN
jgi:general secretion pathway protein C